MRINYFSQSGDTGRVITGDSIGTMTGPLILKGDPTKPLEAATKQYVDNSAAHLDASNVKTGILPIGRLPGYNGDVTSTSGSNNFTLTNTGVVAGEYCKNTVNNKGRITASFNLSLEDIPPFDWVKIERDKPNTIGGYGITNSIGTSGGTVQNAFQLANIPVNSLDAANRSYVDYVSSGNAAIAIGDIIHRAVNVTPDGFLRCNYGEVSIVDYNDLYRVLYGDNGLNGNDNRTMPGNGKPWKHQYAINSTQNADISDWAAHGDITFPVKDSAAIVTKNRAYLLGGNDGTSDIERVMTTVVNSDGSLGTWTDNGVSGTIPLTGSTGNFDVPAGITQVTVIGSGGSGTTTNDPGQPYIAPTITGTYNYTVGERRDVSAEGNVTFAPAGLQTGTLSFNITHDPLTDIPATVTESFTDINGATVGPFTLYLNNGSPSHSSGVWTAIYSDSPNGYPNTPSTSTYEVHYTVSDSALTVTDPGQPYIAPSTTYTTGASTTLTLNGQTYTFAGGYGGTATPATQHITLPGLTQLSGSYSIATGGSLSLSYIDKALSITNGAYLPAGLSKSNAIVTKNTVYLIGGIRNNTSVSSIYKAVINSDGTLGPWTIYATTLPSGISASQVIFTNARIYVIGGYTTTASSTVYTAVVDSNGVIDGFTLAGPLPSIVYNAEVIVTNTRVYLLGGTDATATVNLVYFAPINLDGTLGDWQGADVSTSTFNQTYNTTGSLSIPATVTSVTLTGNGGSAIITNHPKAAYVLPSSGSVTFQLIDENSGMANTWWGSGQPSPEGNGHLVNYGTTFNSNGNWPASINVVVTDTYLGSGPVSSDSIIIGSIIESHIDTVSELTIARYSANYKGFDITLKIAIPYVPAYSTYSQGDSTVVTVDGKTFSTPGSSTSSAPVTNTQTLTIGGLGYTLNYTVPNGGSITIMYTENKYNTLGSINKNLTGSGTETIQAGVKNVSITGQGGQGSFTAIPNNVTLSSSGSSNFTPMLQNVSITGKGADGHTSSIVAISAFSYGNIWTLTDKGEVYAHNGSSWTTLNPLPYGNDYVGVSGDSLTAYALSSNGNLYQGNGSGNWSLLTTFPGGQGFKSLARDGGTIYALTSSGIVYTYSGSTLGTITGLSMSNTWASITVAPGGNIYALNDTGGVYHTNGGNTWAPVGDALPVNTGYVSINIGTYVGPTVLTSTGLVYFLSNGIWERNGDLPGSSTALALTVEDTASGNRYAIKSNGDIYVYSSSWNMGTTSPGNVSTTGNNSVIVVDGITHTFSGGVGVPAQPSTVQVNVTPDTIISYSYDIAFGGSGSLSYTTKGDPVQGSSTTITLNGSTYTFPGGLGGVAPITTSNVVLPGTGSLTANYSVASLGSLNINYDLPSILILTGNNSFDIPAGVTSVTIEGKGADNSVTPTTVSINGTLHSYPGNASGTATTVSETLTLTGDTILNCPYNVPATGSLKVTFNTVLTNLLLPDRLSKAQTYTTKNKVYLFGGSQDGVSKSAVYTSTINANGTLSSWTISSALPDALSCSQIIATKNSLYLLGGNTTTPIATVYKGTIFGGLNDYSAYYNGTITPVTPVNFRLPDMSSREALNDFYFIKY